MDNTNWISNLDQTPAPNQDVLFGNKYSNEIMIAHISKNSAKPLSCGTMIVQQPLPYKDYEYREATHWMLLPSPPKNK